MQRHAKFMLISALAHSLLLVALFVGSAFVPAKEKPVTLASFKMFQLPVTDEESSGGGGPTLTPTPTPAPAPAPAPTPAPVAPPPEPVAQKPAPIEPPAPVVVHDPPKPVIKRIEPKVVDKPKPLPPKIETPKPVVSNNKMADPVKPKTEPKKIEKPKVDITQIKKPDLDLERQKEQLREQRREEIRQQAETAAREEREERDRQARAREDAVAAHEKAVADAKGQADRLNRERAAKLANIANSLETGASRESIISMPEPGGAAFINYSQAIWSTYYEAWRTPQERNAQLTVKVEIIVAKDGSVLSAKITSKSGDASVDKTVQDTLNRVRSLPAFPSNTSDEKRTFKINFNLKAKRQLG